MRRGFSLVELSIVLVIVGLLVGGILAGQSLIRASELRAVGTEYARYFSAMQAFRDKFFAIPGDFAEATRIWGRQNSNADCVTNSSAPVSSDGGCDGNGNTIITGSSASSVGEYRQFWRQLVLAGLIDGNYSGASGAGGTNHCVFDVDCPISKLDGAGWDVYRYGPSWTGDGSTYAGNYGQLQFVFGKQSNSGIPELQALRPEEAWSIDSKLDDGMPGTGKIVPRFRTAACATSTSATDYASLYNLSDDGIQCALYFRQLF
jgi:prepilin-type N-terminal cleavage/methylation domain-containing protein